MTVKLPPSCNCPTCTARTGTGASRTQIAEGKAAMAALDRVRDVSGQP